MEKFFISSDKTKISPKELISLWEKAGWGSAADYQEEKVKKALENTSFFIYARDNNKKLIGFARVLSDLEFHTVIAEIVVDKSFQRKGIGKKIMEEIKKQFKNTSIYLDCFIENEVFFEKCGFVKRNNMSVFSKHEEK